MGETPLDSDSVTYAEGFTQHRGNAIPREDPLTLVLSADRVKTL